MFFISALMFTSNNTEKVNLSVFGFKEHKSFESFSGSIGIVLSTK